MEREIVFAGFGGQGVLTAGLIVAHVAMDTGKEVLWMPAYGGQMRGGKSYSLVKFSDEPICHPDIEELDVLVAMNRPSLEAFSGYLKPDGLLIINSDAVGEEVSVLSETVRVIRFPAVQTARNVQNPKGANIATLGKMIAETGFFSLDEVQSGLLKFFEEKGKGAYAAVNAAALKAGFDYAADKRTKQ